MILTANVAHDLLSGKTAETGTPSPRGWPEPMPVGSPTHGSGTAFIAAFAILAIPRMFPNYIGKPKPAQPKPGRPDHGCPVSLFAADAGIVFDPGIPGYRAGHSDPASHPPLCLYAARGGTGDRATAAVRFTGRQLFQYSHYGFAGRDGPGGPERRFLRPEELCAG